jgi:DNA invertase Pin-like site-specific DNA recombinase
MIFTTRDLAAGPHNFKRVPVKSPYRLLMRLSSRLTNILAFGIFASLAEFERDLISERTRAGLASARARGRKGGRRPKMTPAKLRLAMAAMGERETNVGALCRELGITRSTLYRHVSPIGEARVDAARVLNGPPARTRMRGT